MIDYLGSQPSLKVLTTVVSSVSNQAVCIGIVDTHKFDSREAPKITTWDTSNLCGRFLSHSLGDYMQSLPDTCHGPEVLESLYQCTQKV